MSWRTSHRADFSLGFTPANKVFPGLALEKTDFYRMWMAPRGLPPVWPICLNVVTRPLVPDAAVVILRQPDAATSSSFSEAELDFGNLLLPHLQLAFGVQMEISAAEWRRNALQEVIERWHMGVILLDSKGRLLKSNRSADRTLAAQAGLRLGDQKLWAPLAEDNRNLQTAIAVATENAARRRFHLEESFYFMRERGRPNLEFTIKPLLSGVPGSAVSDAVVAVLIANLDEVSTFPAKTVRRLYSLTGAEIELLQLLVEGASLSQAADRRNVAIATARGQLQEIFSKTGTKKQSELIQLVCAGIMAVWDEYREGEVVARDVEEEAPE